MPEPVLELRDVHVEYNTDDGIVHAVRGASYGVFADETLALVGESGCGKSQSAYAAMGLIQPPGRVTRGFSSTRTAADRLTSPGSTATAVRCAASAAGKSR